MFDKVFASFWHLTHKNLAQKRRKGKRSKSIDMHNLNFDM
jgi:hypothetical protein